MVLNSKFPIIFLDIDGVLNCEIFYRNRNLENLDSYPLCELDAERVKLIDELCQVTGAKIVISSTWRLGRTIEELRNIFKQFGFQTEIIDYTPFFRDSWCVRGNEIRYWLDTNTEKLFNMYSFNFKHYAIIDDDNDMLLTQKDHFFETSTFHGLTPTICENIIKFFSKQIWPTL